MKKGVKAVFVLLLLGFVVVGLKPTNMVDVFANETEQESEENISTEIIKRIEEIDLSELEEQFENQNLSELFDNKSLKETLTDLIVSGEGLDILKVFDLVYASIKAELSSCLKLVALIVAIVGFGGFSEMLQGTSKKQSGMSGVINFFILTVILSLVASIITGFVADTTNILSKTKTIMEILFPLILSLLVVAGGSASSAMFQPAVVVLTGGVIEIVTIVTTSTITIYLVLSVLGELAENVRLDKLKGFVSSVFKWVIGLVFTIFMGYLSLSGITSSGADGLSIKTAIYAIKSYLPLVGGYVSDSYEIFRVGSVVIKNSIGVIGVVLLFSIIIGKVVTLILYNLGFKLASGLSEPFGMSKITKFLTSLSTIFNFLIAGIVVCFLLSAITLYILMSVGNMV